MSNESRWSLSSLIVLCTALSALMTTGCASYAPPIEVKIQASLRQPCQQLRDLEGGTGADVLPWALETVKAYRVCSDRHRRLSEAVAPLPEPD